MRNPLEKYFAKKESEFTFIHALFVLLLLMMVGLYFFVSPNTRNTWLSYLFHPYFTQSVPANDVKQICVASYKNGTYPGMIEDTWQMNTELTEKIHQEKCMITYGNDVLFLAHYHTLPPANYEWVGYAYPSSQLPKNAVLGGQEPLARSLRNLYICRINTERHYAIGMVVDGLCHVAAQHAEHSEQWDTFEVLVKKEE